MSVGDIISPKRIFRVEPCCLQVKATCLILILSLELSRITALNGISAATGFAVAIMAVLLAVVLLLAVHIRMLSSSLPLAIRPSDN